MHNEFTWLPLESYFLKLGSKGLFVFPLRSFCNYGVKTCAILYFKMNNYFFGRKVVGVCGARVNV